MSSISKSTIRTPDAGSEDEDQDKSSGGRTDEHLQELADALPDDAVCRAVRALDERTGGLTWE